ncbi:hypothetical protein [Agromyces subbeticus]|uniref:hypothetical protein n=1 Tax=Agromyces subbeticus TaxID=293890 RepID=UPI0003B428B9|nr:hypothetical protein [Agromyces subbeticus]
MLSDDEYNATGTFLYPPRARSFEQHVKFWANVPVSDGILDNVRYGYEEWKIRWHNATINSFRYEWQTSNRIKPGRITDKEQAALDAACEAESDRLDGVHPPAISSLNTRTIARVGMMVWNRTTLAEADQDRVLELKVDVGVERSAREVFERFAIGNILDSFSEPNIEVLRSLNHLRREQMEIGQSTIAQLGG